MAAHEVDYLAQADRHRFRYRIGAMIGQNRDLELAAELHWTLEKIKDDADRRKRAW